MAILRRVRRVRRRQAPFALCAAVAVGYVVLPGVLPS
jgi:hypothetical protein